MERLNKIVCAPEEVNLKSVFADNIILYNQNFKRKNIKVKYTSNINKKVIVDMSMLEVIIKNILEISVNLISQNGQLSINIDSDLAHARIQFLYSTITNNQLENLLGKGINKVSNKIDLQTYIGFQLCEEFISKNNGVFKIQANKEEGTSLIIQFPLGKEHIQETKKSANLNVNNIPPKKALKSILIVEDNEALRDILEYKFSQSFITFTAENGEKGVELATQKMPDIIISDIDMPVLNGKDMCNILKSNNVTSHIPIIIISAHDSVFDQIEGLQLGVDDYVIKPFEVEVLNMKAQNLLQNREKHTNFIKKPTSEFPETSEEIFVKKVVNIIEENVNSGDLNVAFLASKIGYSQAKLYRKFISSFNQKPSEIIKKYKLKRAHKMLQTKQFRVADVAYECGFNDPHYFSRCFYDEYKFVPSDIINGNVMNVVV